jgi:hypothetical protein
MPCDGRLKFGDRSGECDTANAGESSIAMAGSQLSHQNYDAVCSACATPSFRPNKCHLTSGLAAFGKLLAVIAYSSPLCGALGVRTLKFEP